MRTYTFCDKVIGQFERLWKPPLCQTARPSPAEHLTEVNLTPNQIKQSIGLMRVNHAGEKAAQGLYLGQALTAREAITREHMQQAAVEEIDHLAWCHERIDALGGKTSYLDPLWYAGSVAIGAMAGLLGDRYSLGFIAETEKQVSAHLQKHLTLVPATDHKSIAILAQMQNEEEQHAKAAIQAGAKPLPRLVKTLMKITSKMMVITAYHF